MYTKIDDSTSVLDDPRRLIVVEVNRAVRRLIDAGTDPRRIVHMAADRLTARDLRTMAEAAAPVTPAGRRTWFVDEITAIEDGWPTDVDVRHIADLVRERYAS